MDLRPNYKNFRRKHVIEKLHETGFGNWFIEHDT